MGRHRVIRQLPPLPEIAGHPVGFQPQEGCVQLLAGRLRSIARQTRRDKSHPFYAMREVAHHFRVSIPTVARAYKLLEDEGLLTRIRGSQTLLPGKKLQPRHPIRGVVGIAVALPTFLYGISSRLLYIRLEEELRHRRFVADFIFYRLEDESQHLPELVQRLLEHQLDIVLWFAPDKCVIPAMLQLQDGGIQLLCIGDGKARYPREQYYFDIWCGITDGIKAWQKEGIDYIAIFGPEYGRWKPETEIKTRVLESVGIRHDMYIVSDAETAMHLKRLTRRPRTGVILFQHHWYESLCDKFPQIMEKLFRSCRVMLGQGAVVHGFFEGKQVFADSVTWPHDQVAGRIAQDISSGKIATTERLATFLTCWQPRVDLGKIHEEHWMGSWDHT